MAAATKAGSGSSPRRAFARLWAWGAAVLLVAAVALLYRGTLSYPYVLDDDGSIAANPSIRRLWPLSGPLSAIAGRGETVAGRPVLNLSFALNYAVGGTQVRGYRAGNIAIHACAALLLFGLVRRTCLRMEAIPAAGVQPTEPVEVGPPLAASTGIIPLPAHATLLAFAVALVWAVHPLQTESVTYVVQRAESLMGLFFLLTLYAFARGACAEEQGEVPANGQREGERQGRGGAGGGVGAGTARRDGVGGGRLGRAAWLALAVAACALGMATKEVMVAAPLIVLLYDRTFLSGSFGAALRARPRPYAALASTWLLLAGLVAGAGSRAQTIGPSSGIGPVGYGLCQARALFRYLRLAYWPSGQVFDYGSDRVERAVSVLPHILLLLALLGVVVWALRGPARSARSAAGFLGACFFLILAPTSSFVGGTRQMLAEHRLYLPLAALVLLTAAGLRAGLGRGRAVLVLLAAAAALGAATLRRNAVYATALSLYGQTAERRPGNAWARCNYGNALEAAHRPEEALLQYDEALRLMPELPEAHFDRGVALDAIGRRAEAVAEYTAAIQLPGTSPAQVVKALFNRGLVRDQLGDRARAMADYTAVAAWPGAPSDQVAKALLNVGLIRGRQGDRAGAIAAFGASIRLNPADPGVYLVRGAAYEAAGAYAQAACDYETAVRAGLGPDALNALAWLLAVCPDDAIRDGPRAVDSATKACALTAWREPNGLDTLAAACAEAGRFDEAVAWETRALALTQSAAGANDQRQRLNLYRQRRPYRETRPPPGAAPTRSD